MSPKKQSTAARRARAAAREGGKYTRSLRQEQPERAVSGLYLLPAEENFLTGFFDLEELLLVALGQVTEDARTGADVSYVLPAGLDGEAAHGAWSRITAALPRGLRGEYDALETGRPVRLGTTVVGPGGYEYTPLYAARLDPADIDVLVELLGHCHKALAGVPGYAGLLRFLDDAGHWHGANGPGQAPENAAQVVDRLARPVAVLQLRDADTRTLLAAVTAAVPGRRVVLTGQQERAVRRYLARVADAGTEGKPAADRTLAWFTALGSFPAE